MFASVLHINFSMYQTPNNYFEALRFLGNKFKWILQLTSMFLWLWLIFLGRMDTVHFSNMCYILHLLAWLWSHTMCLVKSRWDMCFGESPYVSNIQYVVCFFSLISAEQPGLHQCLGILYGLIIQTPNSCQWLIVKGSFLVHHLCLNINE